MFRCGQQKGSTIGRVLDERGSGPEKTVGTAEARDLMHQPQWIAAACDRVLKRSRSQETSGKPDAWKLARPVWGWGRGGTPRPTPLWVRLTRVESANTVVLRDVRQNG